MSDKDPNNYVGPKRKSWTVTAHNREFTADPLVSENNLY